MNWFKPTKLTPDSKTAKTRAKKVTDYFSEKRIVFFPSAPSKRQVLGSLIATLDLADPSAALKAILAREESGSTIIAPGLALPHARLEGVKRIEAALGICPEGVSDPHDGGTPLRVFVLFVGPGDPIQEHLAFLAGVSTLFQKAGLIDQLTKLATPQGVLHALLQA